jgi:DeoR/GlpR family transcriptional regulator of sugar metabolism
MRSFIEQHQVVTLPQLSELLPDVSLMTIHRDLSYLQDQGLVIKIRGGARYTASGPNEPIFAAREMVNRIEKQHIAQKALPFLIDASSVFIDAGTTTTALAKMIPDVNLNITTIGPNIAMELSKKNNPVINICGGTLNKTNLSISGTPTTDAIAKINIDTAFVVAAGYSNLSGFTCGKESEARTKAMVMQKARRAILLMDCSKLDRLLPYTFAHLQDIDYLITDRDKRDLPADVLAAAEAGGVAII